MLTVTPEKLLDPVNPSKTGGSGGTALFRWLSLGTDRKLFYEKAPIHRGRLDTANLTVLECIKNGIICSIYDFFL